MIIRKSHAAVLALAIAASALSAAPGFAQNRKQTRASQTQAPVTQQTGVHDDLWRYGNRDGTTVWLPGTTSPRVSGH
jgi:hypothetical protein